MVCIHMEGIRFVALQKRNEFSPEWTTSLIKFEALIEALGEVP